jgi:hypothetical protein
MSYKTTGQRLGTKLSYLGKQYSILDEIYADPTKEKLIYPAITVDTYRSLPDDDRNDRIAAFYAMLGINDSQVLDTNKAVMPNADCDDGITYYRIAVSATHDGIAKAKTPKVNDEPGIEKEMYAAGELVCLSTTPDDPERSFLGWFIEDSDNDEPKYRQQNPDPFTADKDLTLEARYADSLYGITVDELEQKNIVNVPKEGKTYQVTVASEGAGWGISNLAQLPGWLSISKTSAELVEPAETVTTPVDVTVAANSTKNGRSATVTFCNNGNTENEAILSITQDPGDGPITVKVIAYMKRTGAYNNDGDEYGIRLTTSEAITEEVKVRVKIDFGGPQDRRFDFECILPPRSEQVEVPLLYTFGDLDVIDLTIDKYESTQDYNGRPIEYIQEYDLDGRIG